MSNILKHNFPIIRKNVGKTASILDLSAAGRCALVLFVLFLEEGKHLG
jgi:hypothetical protein